MDGYDALTLYNEAKKYNFDVSKVKVNVETTCSHLVCVCINYTGIKLPSETPCRGNYLKRELQKRNKDFTFENFSSNKKLYRGDILIRSSVHTAVVL